MRRQLAVTIIGDVRRDRVAALRAELTTMAGDPAGNSLIPFGRFSTTHFARFILLPEALDLDEQPIPAKLVYLADIDEPRAQHFDDLLSFGGAGLDRLFGNCEGYSKRSTSSPRDELRLAWLQEHEVEPSAAYVNTVGRTLEQVQEERRLHEEIAGFVDESAGDWEGLEPTKIRGAIQDFVNTRPDFDWAREPLEEPGITDLARQLPGMLALPVGLLALAPFVVPALPLWATALFARELTDPVDHEKPDDRHIRELAKLEDRAAHNQFSAVGFAKPGFVRRTTINTALKLLDYGSKNIFNRGSLTGVRTIHFARWTYVDDRGRVLFASNYDGSLESYMDDFIDKVAWGLNAVFSNGVGYPRTFGLIFGGARREQEFKDFLRRRQVPPEVWYSAYPELTAANIANNAHVRAGLCSDLSEEETERWLARI
ncbi:MAG: hypothetical protein WAP35_03820 [Solirubrobacterales bacterium]